MSATHVSDTLWRVDSDTSSKIYDVMLHVPSCNCQGYAMSINKHRKIARENGRDENAVVFECKHIKEARSQARLRGFSDGTTEHEDQAAQRQRETVEKEAKDILAEFQRPVDVKKITEGARGLLDELRDLQEGL